MTPDILTKIILPAALFLIMFGMGLSLKLNDFRNIFQSPKALTVGLIGQLLILPIIAFVIAIAFQLPPEIAVGLMIIALAPGGATSNMFTYLSKGDVSLSVSLTAVVSLITPFTIPFVATLSMFYFMGSETEFSLPVVETIIKLLVITVLPIGLGMIVYARWASFATRLESFFKWFSIAFLMLIVMLIVYKSREDMLSYFALAGVATLLLNIVVLALGYWMAKQAKLNHAQSVSIGFEVGIQNGTLALMVAGTLIGNQAMMIPAVTYSLIMFATGAAFGWWVTHKNRAVSVAEA